MCVVIIKEGFPCVCCAAAREAEQSAGGTAGGESHEQIFARQPAAVAEARHITGNLCQRTCRVKGKGRFQQKLFCSFVCLCMCV